MRLTEEIARRMGLRVTVDGGLPLIASADADAFLDGCQRSGVRVLGIDGLRIQGPHTVPDMGAIADFSRLKAGDLISESILEARRFVRLVGTPDMLFDFTLDEGR